MAFPHSELSRRLGTALPLWQAPMPFNIIPNTFSAEITAAGALGILRIGESDNCKDIQDMLDSCRQKHSLPAICFTHRLPKYEQFTGHGGSALQYAANEHHIPYPLPAADHFLDMLDTALAVSPSAVGFANGVPEKDVISFIKAQEIFTFAIVSNVLEALTAADFGIDCLVLQGIEAGGEQFSFDNNLPNTRQSAMALLQQVRTLTPLPLVLWGDFTQGADIVAAILAGAQAVMLDRAFLQCALNDSGIAAANEYESKIDDCYTIRPMRYLPAAQATPFSLADLSPTERENFMAAYVKQHPEARPCPAAASSNALPTSLPALLAELQQQAGALIG